MSDKGKRKFVFTRDEFTKDVFINLNGNKIVVWDDAGFLMQKPDTLEKIQEDFIKLFEEYIEAMESPELFFTSIYSAFRKIHIRNVFLIGFVGIITRIERLKTKC